MMRMARGLASVLMIAACSRGNDTPPQREDGTLLSHLGGEVALSDGSKLQFVITSERYKRWEAAQHALDRAIAARFGALLRPKSPTEQSIERATAFLESDVRARQAILRTGMSVRDFVLMTVALEQEMQLARGQDGFRQRAESASGFSTVRPYVDTALVAPPPLPNLAPQRPDTPMRVDTGLPPKRQMLRDSTQHPPPDTLTRSKAPRDSLSDTASLRLRGLGD